MKQKSSRWQTTQGRETTASGGEGKQERKKKKKERRESIPSVALNRTKGQQPLRGTDASFSWGSNVAETHDDEIKKKEKVPFFLLSFFYFFLDSLSLRRLRPFGDWFPGQTSTEGNSLDQIIFPNTRWFFFLKYFFFLFFISLFYFERHRERSRKIHSSNQIEKEKSGT